VRLKGVKKSEGRPYAPCFNCKLFFLRVSACVGMVLVNDISARKNSRREVGGPAQELQEPRTLYLISNCAGPLLLLHTASGDVGTTPGSWCTGQRHAADYVNEVELSRPKLRGGRMAAAHAQIHAIYAVTGDERRRTGERTCTPHVHLNGGTCGRWAKGVILA
jgi:hypothetical protein